MAGRLHMWQLIMVRRGWGGRGVNELKWGRGGKGGKNM